jgi:hypothetical protein
VLQVLWELLCIENGKRKNHRNEVTFLSKQANSQKRSVIICSTIREPTDL